MLRLRLAFLVALLALLAACGGAVPSSGVRASPENAGPSAAPTGAASSEPPTAAAPTDEPFVSAEPDPTADTGTPTTEPEPTPSEVPGAGGVAAACSGNDKNRTFYASVAKAVDWQVVCPVLGKGWFVSTGSYRLANGGKVEVAYRGPGGAGLTLSQGGFCTVDGGCVPPGTDAGAASLGGMPGTLVALDSGGFAIVVDRGANPSWLLVANGLSRQATLDIGSAAARVGG